MVVAEETKEQKVQERRPKHVYDQLHLNLPDNLESNSGFSLGGIGKELEWNNIDSYRYRRKGSLLIQRLYLWDRDRERGKNGRFHSHSTFDRKINLSYPSLNEKTGQILQDQTYGT